jgi:hypothetical protein
VDGGALKAFWVVFWSLGGKVQVLRRPSALTMGKMEKLREMVWWYVLAPEGELAIGNFLWDGGFERVGNGRTATFGSRDQKEDALRCKVKKGCNTSVLRTCRKV